MFASDIKYATRVWLTSVFLSPPIFIFFQMLGSGFSDLGVLGNLREIGGFYLLMVIYGGILSIPCWLLFMLAVRAVFRTENKMFNKKMIIQAIAMVLCALPFLVFFWEGFEGVIFGLPYVITLSMGIWYFDLSHQHQPVETIDHLID